MKYMILLFWGNYEMDLSIDLSNVLTIIGASVAFVIALLQYKKAQDWKRGEFVYQLVQNFRSDFNVKRAFRMLDWSAVDIPLLENEIYEIDLETGKEQGSKYSFFFKDDLLISALRNHLEMDINKEGFSDEETVIRFVFDDFFDKLGQFNQFIDKKLITKDDISNYLIYWIRIIGDKEFFINKIKIKEIRFQIWNYLISYEYEDVIKLCDKFGYKIKVN